MSPKQTTTTEYPRLVVFSAPSGAGKTTLTRMLLKDFPTIQLSVSATTRSRRPTEQEGIHYQFLTVPQFKQAIAAGDFIEWAEVHGHLYGTLKSQVDRAITAGKTLLFDIDVQGAMNIRGLYPRRALLIFVLPPSMEELKKRLSDRKTESSESLETRITGAYNELAWSEKFDYQVTNDDLTRAYTELKTILSRECP